MVGEEVRIIPLASLVKEVRPLKQKSMKDVMKLFDNVAEEYASRYWSVDQYKGQINQWLNSIPKGGQVLDLGCGPGNYADHALGKRPDLDWKGVDFSPAMIRIAKDSVPRGDFMVGDATDRSIYQGKGEGVMISFVTPYLDNGATKKMIKRVHRYLENEGMLYLGTIVGEIDEVKAQRSTEGESNSLVTYYRKVETYQGWLERQGFEIINIEKKSVDYGNETTDEAIILAQKIED